MFEAEQKFHQQGYEIVIGIDEAGRGPLAGPVVASAVCLKDFHFTRKISDSKKLSAPQRFSAYQEILQKAYVGVGIVDESVIDKINILQATFLAMNQAVEKLIQNFSASQLLGPDLSRKTVLLVDGNRFKTALPYDYHTIIKGDLLVFSISCASIVAKVTRDKILDGYDSLYPQYGFKQHKGYGTAKHKHAIKEHGLLSIHRKTFCQKA